MMDEAEADEFRRMQLVSEVERANDLIARYRKGIDFYRGEINKKQRKLGRIAERHGEPEEGEAA